ncbi:GNAT family N-acetyltransferase [Streptococcus dentiloxodontae]
MELRRPTAKDKAAILDMINEFETSNSSHDGEDGFWNSGCFDYDDWLSANLANEIGISLPEGHVPSIQFVAFEGDRAIGFLNLRLRLNGELLEIGGHIGYAIRPSERGKGYAKMLLCYGLKEAKLKNIDRALLTCRTDNAASRSVIKANGGRLEDIRAGVERYWIELTDWKGDEDGK